MQCLAEKHAQRSARCIKFIFVMLSRVVLRVVCDRGGIERLNKKSIPMVSSTAMFISLWGVCERLNDRDPERNTWPQLMAIERVAYPLFDRRYARR